MYARFQTIADDPAIIDQAKDEWRGYYRDPDPYIAEQEWQLFAKNFAAGAFIRENATADGDSVFASFPVKAQLSLIDKWLGRRFGDYWLDYEFGVELCKLFALLWPKYSHCTWQTAPRTYPHNEFFNAVYKAREQLRDILKWKSRDDMMAYRRTYDIADLYVHHHLLGLLHLMGDEGVRIFEHIAQYLDYSDGQEYLWFSIKSWSPPQQILPALRTAWLSGHDRIDMRYQMQHVAEEWQRRHNIDLLADPVIGQSLQSMMQ